MSNDVFFTSGTSCEQLAVGAFDPVVSDDGDPQGPYHWGGDFSDELGQICSYASGEAYDYAAHGMTRNPFLVGEEGEANGKYLSIGSQESVHRSIFSRQRAAESFSNVVVRSGARESVYCDMLMQLSPSESPPTLDAGARIAVWTWLREDEDGGATTNLMVTAGCFTNSFKGVSARNFRLDLSEALTNGLDASKWYRLTIRAHGDVSAKGNEGLAGFTVYLDGKPVRAFAEDYAFCELSDWKASKFLPEARALVAERRLFAGLTPPHQDLSFSISGLTFTGECRVDDVTISSDDPGFAKPEAVFTLNWDDGFTALAYAIDGAEPTNAPLATARSRDILIGSAPTNGLTLKVTSHAYDTAAGFKAGVWHGTGGATLTNGTDFAYDGTTRNPVAYAVSAREAIKVNGTGKAGGFRTFRSAFLALDDSTNDVKVLTLSADVTVSTKADGYAKCDFGFVEVDNPAGEYVLDLAGHTLKGASQNKPTLVVRCKSLRIVDTGAPDASGRKTGRILPVDDYLNPTGYLNTAVLVKPASVGETGFVEPVLTIDEAICDGWVRNEPDLYVDGNKVTNAAVGAVFVNGGSYVSTNGAAFYLDSCVTNAALQYVYRDGYWAPCDVKNAVIWTGLGDGRRWVDPDNWKSHAVPKPTEIALFPSREEGLPPWTVDVEDNRMTTKNLWLEGDVDLSGTNDFVGVTLTGEGLGRFGGDATLVYTNAQPGKLTETTIRADWAGTVVLRNVGASVPKVLSNLETWGTTNSTVVFNGVRGYVRDTASHTMPYAFVLEDLVTQKANGTVVTNYAWQNDSGYTGSTLTFLGPLSGTGTFRSGSNIRPLLQLFRFADVQDFRGRFSVDGKRVLLGSATVMSSVSGLLAFGDHAVVNSGLGWTCRNALFGSSLHVWGDTNDVIVTCTAAEPDVSACLNLTLNGHPNVAWLACTNDPPWTVYVSGVLPPTAVAPSLGASAAPNAVFASAALSALASSDGYSAAALLPAAYKLATLAVDMADVSISVGETEVSISVENCSRGLWYGVRSRASLSDEWSEPKTWVCADGPTTVLTCEKTDESCFYGVVVSVENPSAGGGADD